MREVKCDKCPKGKYMVSKCNITPNSTECETCPTGSYTGEENNLLGCFACNVCSSTGNLVIEKECVADKDTQCKCKQGYYCKHPDNNKTFCHHCIPVSKCPQGTGVASHHTFSGDTVCKPCLEGTYSDVDDYSSSCKNHTSCEDLGRYVKIPGTDKSDVECGDLKCTTTCSWLLPASLWAGFVITLLVVLLALFIVYWRNKHRSKRSVISSSPVLPVLPPDILKHPADCDVEKCAEHHICLTHLVDNYPDMDSNTYCDGGMPTMTVSDKYSESTAANGYTDYIKHHSIYQSEPQESEWND